MGQNQLSMVISRYYDPKYWSFAFVFIVIILSLVKKIHVCLYDGCNPLSNA